MCALTSHSERSSSLWKVVEIVFGPAIGAPCGDPFGVAAGGILMMRPPFWTDSVHRAQQRELVMKEQIVKVHAVSLLIEQPGARFAACRLFAAKVMRTLYQVGNRFRKGKQDYQRLSARNSHTLLRAGHSLSVDQTKRAGNERKTAAPKAESGVADQRPSNAGSPPCAVILTESDRSTA